MGQDQERRKHRRLEIRLPLECRTTHGGRKTAYRTVTCDISAGGLCFEVESNEFPVGTTLDMELGVPPGDGHSPYPGRVRGTGRVVRVERLPRMGPHPRWRIATQLSKVLKLVF